MENYYIYTDGGARGNPGPAGVGVVIQNEKKEIITEIKKFLGTATNNQAEYWAVILALEWIVENTKSEEINIAHYLDSQLVEQQLKGNYKVKNEGLKPLFERIISLVEKIGKVEFTHIPRRQNKHADALANEAMDNPTNN